MIAAIVVVCIFLVLGLGTVFIAMSGGARGARRRMQTQSPGGRRAVGLSLAVIILGIGLAVPIVVGARNNDSHSKRAPGGIVLTAAQKHGRVLFAQNCSTCHTLRAANAVGVVGTNLDSLHPPEALILDAIAKGRARGNGQMPAGLVTGQDAKDVASFVARVAGHG
jgi:mono/diheme cytochrome c family protein